MELLGLADLHKYYSKYYHESMKDLPWEEKLKYFKKREAMEKTKELKASQEQGMLCAKLYKIFPDQAAVNQVVWSLNYQNAKQKTHDVYTEEYLPQHTRNNTWLKKYVKTVAETHNPGYKFLPESINYFVKDGIGFKVMRNDYEQRVVAAQIPYMLKNPVSNVLMGDEPSPYLHKGDFNYDKFFRSEVVRIMSGLGIDKRNIEYSLEQNADLWRKQTMEIAFENQYYPLMNVINDRKEFKPWWNRFAKLKQAHQTAWIKRREYEYYQDHKTIIDKLDVATKAMKMKPNELKILEQKIKFYEKMRAMMLGKKKMLQIDHTHGLKNNQTQNQDQGHTI